MNGASSFLILYGIFGKIETLIIIDKPSFSIIYDLSLAHAKFHKTDYLASETINSFISTEVSWVPQKQGWFKINTNEVTKVNLGFAGTSGVIRYYNC